MEKKEFLIKDLHVYYLLIFNVLIFISSFLWEEIIIFALVFSLIFTVAGLVFPIMHFLSFSFEKMENLFKSDNKIVQKLQFIVFGEPFFFNFILGLLLSIAIKVENYIIFTGFLAILILVFVYWVVKSMLEVIEKTPKNFFKKLSSAVLNMIIFYFVFFLSNLMGASMYTLSLIMIAVLFKPAVTTSGNQLIFFIIIAVSNVLGILFMRYSGKMFTTILVKKY